MMTPYPPINFFANDFLDVGDGHSLAYWQYGNPDGIAAVYLHGGPGAGSSPTMAQFFNPDKYHIIIFDQRGCGKSTPHASLHKNNTWALVEDLEKLRQHLGFKQWLVCGGSWGSTLALAYAQTHPTSVLCLVLRGIFTLRRAELLWYYQEGASWVYPDLWESFLAPIPTVEHGDLISAYYRRLTGDDKNEQLQCAKAWTMWEGSTLSLIRDASREDEFSDPHFALAFARIESHYFVNGGFMAFDGQLLENAIRLKNIPTSIIQGRYDIVTPMKTAWDLYQKMPEANFICVDDAGHAASETGIAKAIVEATDNFANTP